MRLRFDVYGLNEVISGLAPLRHRPLRFGLAVSIVAPAILLSAAAEWFFGSAAGAIFALMVALSTGFFGVLAGCCTVALAVLALDYFWLPPVFAFNFDAVTLRAALGFGTVCGCAHVLQKRITNAIREKARPPAGIKGYFDGVENQEAYGWALDPDRPQTPITVTVFLDGKPVAQIAAVHYRPDVDEKWKAGAHGFYIDLSRHLQNGRDMVVDARFPDGTLLPNAPQVIHISGVWRRAARPTLLFMHIPKTAGTAFREALVAHYAQSEIAYIYPTPPGFLVGDLRDLPLEQLRELRLVIGHFQFGMHWRLPQASEYITVVREPVARVLSQHGYLRRTRPEAESVTLEQIYETRLTVDFDNAMVRCFSGVDERVVGPGKLTSEHCERAIGNLHRVFAYVGHQEALASSYDDLKRRFGWADLASDLPVVNVGPHSRDCERALASAELIRHHNRWDQMLYQEILKLFPLPDRLDARRLSDIVVEDEDSNQQR